MLHWVPQPNVTQALNLSHTRTPGYWVQVPLETTAGQGASLDYPMDQVNLAVLKELREGG